MENIINILSIMGQGLSSQHLSESAFTQVLKEDPVTQDAREKTDLSSPPDATIRNRPLLKGKKILVVGNEVNQQLKSVSFILTDPDHNEDENMIHASVPVFCVRTAKL
ncbi:MAG: hypothetical protein HQL63_05060 [Magnetococcales bacterium]|nr:hypothetical protein [Magnetococcales bacterium]MBF0322993.1 hypothetical protein [Magnetococcales bacterium]